MSPKLAESKENFPLIFIGLNYVSGYPCGILAGVNKNSTNVTQHSIWHVDQGLQHTSIVLLCLEQASQCLLGSEWIGEEFSKQKCQILYDKFFYVISERFYIWAFCKDQSYFLILSNIWDLLGRLFLHTR